MDSLLVVFAKENATLFANYLPLLMHMRIQARQQNNKTREKKKKKVKDIKKRK